MKKLLSLLVALCICFGTAASLAEIIQLDEPIPGYEMTITLPEEVESTLDSQNDWHWIRFNYEGPIYDLTIAPSDLFEGKNMSDLTEEDRATLVEQFSDNAAVPSTLFMTLENGLEVFLLEEDTEENDFAVMQALIHGSFVGLTVRNADYAKLNLHDLENMVVIMSSITVAPVDAE